MVAGDRRGGGRGQAGWWQGTGRVVAEDRRRGGRGQAWWWHGTGGVVAGDRRGGGRGQVVVFRIYCDTLGVTLSSV